MLKNILNLNGAQQLSKNEQKEVNGGIPRELLVCSLQCGPSGGVVIPCLVPIGTRPTSKVCCACY
jgi:hypothetical protein